MTFELRIEGVDALRKKLGGIEGHVKPLLEKVATYAEGEARRGAKPHQADTGELARSIKSSLAPGAMPLWIKVYTEKLYAAPVEYGRRPGKMPPVAAIAKWATRHGITTPAFVLARAIGRRGTKGLHYMEKAARATGEKMPDLIRQVITKIEQDWGKR